VNGTRATLPSSSPGCGCVLPIGHAALCILMDYALTVQALERIYAEAYTFNTHSQRLFEGPGFQQEGILRQHEFHNGSLQDMFVFGILKPEFYQRYETISKLQR
jgi:RimJ/RimL family protein N-acetyltransferase